MNPYSLISPTDLGVATLRSMADSLLVVCRLLGLLVLIPGINAPALGWQLRGILLVTLAAIIAPNVSSSIQGTFAHGSIHQVSHDEPALADLGYNVTESVDREDTSRRPVQERSLVKWVHLALAELCLGLLLGVGANLVLQSFRMAGALIEQQIGLSLTLENISDDGDGGTGTGELLFWLGGVLFLIAGGHLLFISTLLDTFRHFPVGYGGIDGDLAAVAASLMHQSVSLALQLAAPIVATQVLVSVTLSYAGLSAPHFHTSGVAIPIRIVTSCLILSLALSGLTERILDTIPTILQISFSIRST